MSSSDRTSRTHGVRLAASTTWWWVVPHKVVLWFVVPVFTLVFVAGGHGQVERMPNYFTASYFMLGLTYLLVLSAASYVASRLALPGDGAGPERERRAGPGIPAWLLDATAALTLIGYVTWFGGLLLDPTPLFNLISGVSASTDGVRGAVDTIPGVTTLAQLAVVYAVLYVVKYHVWNDRRRRARHTVLLGVIVFFVLLRVFAWSERLALLEFLIPVVLLYVSCIYRVRRRTAWMVQLAPILSIAGVVLLFSVTEYFRSWSAFYSAESASLLEFTWQRINAYYYTALNNGAGMLSRYPWPTYDMEYVCGWAYDFPILGRSLRAYMQVKPVQGEFLRAYASPEFNNPSGIYVAFYDLGVAGGLAFAAGTGFVLGRFYRSFVRQRGMGAWLYPVCYIALLEILRVPYLSLSRAFPILLFMFAAAIAVRWLPARRRARHLAGRSWAAATPGFDRGLS